MTGKASDKPESYNMSTSKYIKQTGGNVSFKPIITSINTNDEINLLKNQLESQIKEKAFYKDIYLKLIEEKEIIKNICEY